MLDSLNHMIYNTPAHKINQIQKGKYMLDEVKNFNLRINKTCWLFLKKISAEKEKPMNAIIMDLLDKYKKSLEKEKVK